MTKRFKRHTAAEKAERVARFEAALARGLSENAAAAEAKTDPTTLRAWQEQAKADAASRTTTARRTCLRCGRGFKSAWAGNRICGECARSKSAASIEGLPDSWGTTPTEGYV